MADIWPETRIDNCRLAPSSSNCIIAVNYYYALQPRKYFILAKGHREVVSALRMRHAGRVCIPCFDDPLPALDFNTHRNACHIHDKRYEVQLLSFVLSIDAHI